MTLWRRYTRSEFWLLRTAWIVGAIVLLWTIGTCGASTRTDVPTRAAVEWQKGR